MRNIIFSLFLMLLSCTSNKQHEPTIPGRVTNNFNFNWKFLKGDTQNAHLTDFNDSSWQIVDLPHDWSIKENFSPEFASATGFLPGGSGWYRKSFFIPESESGRKVYIDFDGIYNNSEVWINGEYLGIRPNGYVSFQYDLTKYIRYGSDNIIAVKVDHSKFADSRWYTGSGIYRNVKLISTYPLHIKHWGIYVTTPEVSLSKATINVGLTVLNEFENKVNPEVENILLFGNDTIEIVKQLCSIKGSDESVFNQGIVVKNPKLWDADNPNLYRLVTNIKQLGKVVDSDTTNIGIRKLAFDADKGFSLNDKSMKFKGVCLHHDAGCLGTAVPYKVIERRLKILKEMGCNAIRTSHNPYSSEFMGLCDKMGFLVVNEAYDEWELPKRKWIEGRNKGEAGLDGSAEYFKKWYEKDVTDFILRDRNHPSVIMWSIGNEIDYPTDPYSHPILNNEDNPISWARYNPDLPDGNRLGKIARKLAKIVRKYDTTRPITAGLANGLMASHTGYVSTLDVVGYNYQLKVYEKDHITYPRRIMYSSESNKDLKTYEFITNNDYMLGQFIWIGIDCMGEANLYPSHSSLSGVIDFAGNKKTEYYFLRSLWNEEPTLYIGTLKMRENISDPVQYWKAEPVWNYEEKQKTEVCVFTNCDEVELFLNNKSLGIKKLTDFPNKLITWEVPFVHGTLKAVGKMKNKETVNYELKSAGEVTKMLVNSDVTNLKANKTDVAHINVTLADKNGIPVYLSDKEITCKTNGPIRLLGMEDANPYNEENYSDKKQKSYHGKILIYVQSLDKSGKASIEISSPGVETSNFYIDVLK